MPDIIDLHTHTTCSDGALTPTQLVHKAHEHGLSVLSITDHDTASAALEAAPVAEQLGIEFIPGIEVSAFDPELGREYHILGYYIDPQHPELLRYESDCREKRVHRADRIVEKLQGLGLALTMEHVLHQARAGQENIGVIGRQHIALALQAAGIVRSTKQAFERYLADGRSASVAKWRFTVQQAIDLIHTAGGLAVLAHPAKTIHGLPLVNMVKSGLDGIEIIHPAHDGYLRRYYEQFAKGYRLLMTGGSDYHGNKPVDEAHFGTFSTPREYFSAIRTAHHSEFADW
jgi:3',5'-nucleoside bisphosphate phosphatase